MSLKIELRRVKLHRPTPTQGSHDVHPPPSDVFGDASTGVALALAVLVVLVVTVALALALVVVVVVAVDLSPTASVAV